MIIINIIDIKPRKFSLTSWMDDASEDIVNISDFYVGVKALAIPTRSHIGGFFYLDYKNKGFDMIYPGDTEHKTHVTHSITPALGLRVNTGNFTKAFHWVFEAGGAYNFNFKYKGSYGNKLDVVNNGFTGIYGFGFEYASGGRNTETYNVTEYATKNFYISITLQYHKDYYNFFNENFSPDEGVTKPYQGFKSNFGYLCMSIAMRGSFSGQYRY